MSSRPSSGQLLLLMTSSLAVAAAQAASGTASVTATVVSLADVQAAASSQLLFSSAPGVLTLSIPGSSGNGSSIASSGTDATGTPVFSFSSADGGGPGLTQLAELALSDGTLAGGQGVSLALSGGEGETLVAVVAYN